MFERILVPLDGSRLSAQALEYAVEIGKRFDAEIILARVISPSGVVIAPQLSGIETSSAATDLISQEVQVKEMDNAAHAKRYLMNWVQSLKAQGVKSSYLVTIGTPAKSIMDLVEAQWISLIVMMSHGKGWFKRALIGSVAEAVLHGSKVPVLIIQPKDIDKKLR